MTNITCYDLDGDIVKRLTQWDHSLTLVIDGVELDPIPEFRYSNTNCKDAIPVDGYRTGDYVCAIIPDELLQEDLPIMVQLFYKRQGARTKYSFIIPVTAAKKPSDYKYTPTDEKTWEDIEASIRRDLAYKLSTPNSAKVGDYLRVKVVNIDGTIELEGATVSSGPVQSESYTLPVATSTTLGGVKPVAKTSAMTQSVGVDGNGRLYTAPSGTAVSIDTSLSKSGQAADAKIVGDALVEIESALGSYINDIDALIGGGN